MRIFSGKLESKTKESRKLKKTITENKNSTDKFNSRLDRAEEKINILEYRSEENTQSEGWRDEDRKESEGHTGHDEKAESEKEKR